jgi:hypothetical protein
MLVEKGETSSRIFKLRDHIYKTAQDEKYILAIYQDQYPENPRIDFDHMGTMVCFHSKYKLGDDNHGYDKDDFSSWDELEEQIWENEDPILVLPLFLYDHSGITISTGRFSSSWDSGQVGFIFMKKKVMEEAHFIETAVGAAEKRAKEILEAEVHEYDQYLRGDIYGFILEDNRGNEIESCGGFYGDDMEKNGMKDYIPTDACHLIEKLEGRY